MLKPEVFTFDALFGETELLDLIPYAPNWVRCKDVIHVSGVDKFTMYARIKVIEKKGLIRTAKKGLFKIAQRI